MSRARHFAVAVLALILPMVAFAQKKEPATPLEKYKTTAKTQLGGGAETYYVLMLQTTKVDPLANVGAATDATLFILGVAGEVVISPITIVGALRNDPLLQPGVILKNVPAPDPAKLKQEFDIQIVIVKGRDAATDAVMEFVAPAFGNPPLGGKKLNWVAVKKTTSRKEAVAAADKVEKSVLAAKKNGVKVEFTRPPDAK